MRTCCRLVPILSALLTGGACGVTDTDRVPVGSVVVTPDALAVPVGSTAALDATVTDADGNPLRDRRVVWASADPTIASVSDRGVVTGVRAGRVDVAATAEGKSGIASVTVAAGAARVQSVRIDPDHLDLFVAASATLVATAYDSRGAPVGGRATAWTTGNAAVASVSQTGQVTGLVPGTAVITATIEGFAGKSTITVRLVPVAKVTVVPANVELGAGKSVTLTAEVSDAAGNLLTGRALTWSSGDTRIATVDQNGVVRGVRKGSTVITATVEGKFGRASVHVK